MRTSIVNSKELGTNCWLPARFCGGRCSRVMCCKYPEKASCEAVKSELVYLNDVYPQRIKALKEQHEASITILEATQRVLIAQLKNQQAETPV